MSKRFRDTIRRGYVAFRSPRTTVGIMSVLLGLYFLGLVIPQKSLIRTAELYADWKAGYPRLSAVIEFLRLNEIYLSPITIVFLALFFANLLIVIGHRVPLILRRMYLVRGAEENAAVSPSSGARAITVQQAPLSVGPLIRTFLKKRFWSFVGGDGERTFLAVRNRYSPAGFLLFHASFLLCLVGGILVMYTRFMGTFILTEGQEFVPELKNFTRIYREPKMLKALPPFFLKLEKVSPRYEGEVGTDLDVDTVLTYKNSVEKARLRVNEPVERGALSILALNMGVSPLMVLRDRAGREVDGSYFYLNVLSGREDGFRFPTIPYDFSVRFYPDFVIDGGVAASRSRELKNPVMEMTIKDGERIVVKGYMPIRRHLVFDNYIISFDDIRYWIEFQAVREYGNYPLYAGFLLGGIGLIMRLLFYQKTLRIVVQESAEGTTVLIDGRSEHYPYSFRAELEALSNALEERLRAVEDAGKSAPAG